VGSGAKKRALLSTMYQKRKGLVVNHENHAKIYIIENKIVSRSSVARVMEKRGKNLWKISITY
jgi:hypothetical protein